MKGAEARQPASRLAARARTTRGRLAVVRDVRSPARAPRRRRRCRPASRCRTTGGTTHLGRAGDGDLPSLAVCAGAAEREPAEAEATVLRADVHVRAVVHNQVEVLCGELVRTSVGWPGPSCHSRSRRASTVVEKPGPTGATVTGNHLSDLVFLARSFTLTCRRPRWPVFPRSFLSAPGELLSLDSVGSQALWPSLTVNGHSPADRPRI